MSDPAQTPRPLTVVAMEVLPRTKLSNYPQPFATHMAGRVKRSPGDIFGLRNFGVNLTLLRPGSASTLHHVHSRQDEFIYVVEGEPTLFTDTGPCACDPAW